MTTKFGDYDLPFDAKGNMQQYMYYGSSPGQIKTPNQVMQLDLTIEENSRSGSHVWAVNHDGRRFPVFISDLTKIINDTVIDHGHIVYPQWVGRKKGSHFGVVPYIP